MRVKTFRLLILCIITVILSSGCALYEGITRDYRKLMGIVQVEDVKEAEKIAKSLPHHLRISPERMRVTPLVKYTAVVIYGVNDPIIRDKIQAQVVTYRQSAGGSLKPIRVQFR